MAKRLVILADADTDPAEIEAAIERVIADEGGSKRGAGGVAPSLAVRLPRGGGAAEGPRPGGG